MKHLLSSLCGALFVVSAACSSSNSAPLADGGAATSGGAQSCDMASALGKADFCKSCTLSPNATPNTCRAPRTISACCTYVEPPTQELVRGTGLNLHSSTDP